MNITALRAEPIYQPPLAETPALDLSQEVERIDADLSPWEIGVEFAEVA